MLQAEKMCIQKHRTSPEKIKLSGHIDGTKRVLRLPHENTLYTANQKRSLEGERNIPARSQKRIERNYPQPHKTENMSGIHKQNKTAENTQTLTHFYPLTF